MKKFLLLFVLCSAFHLSYGQSLKKTTISNTGCSLYAYCVLSFEKEYSEDSSIVYTAECVNEAVTYGVICVKLRETMENLDGAEESMISYLNYLKTSFGIVRSAGYGRGHRLNKNENTRGVLDYWEDGDKMNWKVKSWTDGKFICVLYGYSAKELPEQKLNVFLDGFRLPGM